MQGLYFVQWLLILVLPAGLINALQKMCLECQIKFKTFHLNLLKDLQIELMNLFQLSIFLINCEPIVRVQTHQ